MVREWSERHIIELIDRHGGGVGGAQWTYGNVPGLAVVGGPDGLTAWDGSESGGAPVYQIANVGGHFSAYQEAWRMETYFRGNVPYPNGAHIATIPYVRAGEAESEPMRSHSPRFMVFRVGNVQHTPTGGYGYTLVYNMLYFDVRQSSNRAIDFSGEQYLQHPTTTFRSATEKINQGLSQFDIESRSSRETTMVMWFSEDGARHWSLGLPQSHEDLADEIIETLPRGTGAVYDEDMNPVMQF